ncbi:MAG: hypothetical protein AMXMBFR33_47050 [Candidatus Xenobia bacterium]
MRALSLMLTLLCLLALPARPVPVEADLLAKMGAYDEADRRYREALLQTRDPAERRLLQLRRLAVAQLRNDVGVVFQLADELKKEEPLEPEIELRVHLIEGAVAYRTANLARATRAFSRARELASQRNSAGAALALSECESFEFQARLDREGAPTPDEYARACQRTLETTKKAAPTATDPYWPLDITRAGQWTFLWGWQAWEFSFFDHREGRIPSRDAWAGLSVGIFSQAILLADQAYQASNGMEPEFLYLSLRLRTERANHFALLPGVEAWIDEDQRLLDAIDGELKKFPASVVFLGQEQIRGQHHRGMARYHLLHGQVPRALSEFERAAADFARARNPVDEIDVLVEVGYHAFLTPSVQMDRARVEQSLRKAEELTEKLPYPAGRFWATGFLGCLEAERGRLPQAETLLQRSLQEVSSWLAESGASFRGKQELLAKPETRLFVDTLVQVLLKQGKRAQAMEVIAQTSSQSQVSGLDLSRVKSRDPKADRALREIEQSRTRGEEILAELRAAEAQGDRPRVAQLQTRLANNKAEFYRAINTLRANDPELERLVSVKPASFASLQARLPTDSLLVQYAPGEKELTLFVATARDLKIYQSPVGRQELEQGVRRARTALIEQGDLTPLAELYQTLIGPLEQDLADKSTLVVVPNGSLFYLPFAALKNQEGFLVERKAVVVATSAEILNLAVQSAASKPGSLLALANPDRSLPGARQEVEGLAPLFAQKATYYEDQATRERLSAPGRVAVVHLATHGVLNSRDVNESYLVLAGADNKLTNGEIYGLDFQGVSLVTLSACQTNLGQRDPLSGNDVATMAQAFSIAGSRSILASLWKVSDSATAQLMVEFYTQLLAGKSKAEALRLAQIKLIRQPGSTPFQWAAFELIGDWQ